MNKKVLGPTSYANSKKKKKKKVVSKEEIITNKKNQDLKIKIKNLRKEIDRIELQDDYKSNIKLVKERESLKSKLDNLIRLSDSYSKE